MGAAGTSDFYTDGVNVLLRAFGSVVLAGALGIQGCASSPSSGAVLSLPPGRAHFDYQLGGSSPIPDGAAVVARDSTDSPAPGVYGICYINGFQSQPNVSWPSALLLHSRSGELLVDAGWPDEHIFDISTEVKRVAIAQRLSRDIHRCKTAGYRSVEFDNLDSYSRSHGALTVANAISFARVLVAQAHGAGLAAAQKNTAELGFRGRQEIGYDVAITEECDRFDVCAQFSRVYGSRVFNIEYVGELRGTVATVCARLRANRSAPSTIIRDVNLAPSGAPDHFYRAC